MTAKKAFVTLFVMLLITAMFLEGILRIFDIASGAIVSQDLLSQLDTRATIQHPFLQYTARRSYEGYVHFIEPGKTFWVRTNANGFRTHEFYPKTDGQEYRILVLGDSFTYGFNANQEETYPAVLERLLHENISNNIRVYSLGVPSYSGVRYVILARLFFDLLQPDMVIVAVDASDFREDSDRIGSYVVDESGAPVVLKDAKELMQDAPKNFVIDESGALLTKTNDDRSPSLFRRLQFGSSLFRHLADGWEFLRREANAVRFALIERSYRKGKIPVVTYDDLASQSGAQDISAAIPARLLTDFVPYDLQTALQKYTPTLTSLRAVKTTCDRVGATLYLSSYPYPWMVSTQEALAYQVLGFGKVYDMRNNRVQPQLMDAFAAQLHVKHLDAFPFFETNANGSYGKLDPHFNAQGYALYAKFLFENIQEKVRKDLGAGAQR